MGPMTFDLLGVDGIDFSSPDYKFSKSNGVRDVFVLVPSNNQGCTKAHVDKAGSDTYGVLSEEVPESIIFPMGEDLDVEHFLYDMVGMLHFSIDG